jgi:GMP synthase-like glutamine amidotransferase
LFGPEDIVRAQTSYENCAALVVMGGPMSANDALDIWAKKCA